MPTLMEHSAFWFCTYRYHKSHYLDRLGGELRHYFHYVRSGSGKIISHGITLEVRAGDRVYLPMGMSAESYWYATDDDDCILESYGTTCFPEAAQHSFPMQLIPRKFISRFRQIPLDLVPDSHSLSLFFGILSDLVPHLQKADVCPPPGVYQRIQNFVLQTPRCKIPDIAKFLGISVPSLYNLCKPLGKTPNQIKLEIQLDWVVYQLQNVQSSVQSLCNYIGFSSVSYFRKCLKAHTGMTPSQIRKR